MYLRKAQAGSAPGHQWTHDGEVIEVDDDLAQVLLAIPTGGFSEAAPPQEAPVEPEPDPEPEKEPEAAPEPSEDEEPPKPKNKGGRPKKTEITEAE